MAVWNGQGTCIGIIICMWDTRMIRCLRWKITWSGDHIIRTCQGHGVIYYTPITLLVAWRSISMNILAQTLSTLCEVAGAWKRSHNSVGSCTQDMYRRWTAVIVNDVLAASGLLLQTLGYDVGDKKKHLLEDIFCTLVARSPRIGLWFWGFSGSTKLAGREDGASLGHYEMRRGKGMVYDWSRNNWLIAGTAIGASTTLHMMVWPLHVRSTWVDGVGRRLREGDWYWDSFWSQMPFLEQKYLDNNREKRNESV
jgi:hypothetical protein